MYKSFLHTESNFIILNHESGRNYKIVNCGNEDLQVRIVDGWLMKNGRKQEDSFEIRAGCSSVVEVCCGVENMGQKETMKYLGEKIECGRSDEILDWLRDYDTR